MQALGSSEPCPRRVNLLCCLFQEHCSCPTHTTADTSLIWTAKEQSCTKSKLLFLKTLSPSYPPFRQLPAQAGAQELQHTSERLPAEEASSFHTHITPQCGNSGNNTRKGFLITVPACSGQFMQSHKGHGACAKKHKR